MDDFAVGSGLLCRWWMGLQLVVDCYVVGGLFCSWWINEMVVVFIGY